MRLTRDSLNPTTHPTVNMVVITLQKKVLYQNWKDHCWFEILWCLLEMDCIRRCNNSDALFLCFH